MHQTNHYTAMALQGHQISCTTIPALLILKSKLTCDRLLCLSVYPLSLSLSLFSFYPRMEINPLVIMIATPLPGAAFPPRSVTKRETSFVCRRVESLTPHGTTCLPAMQHKKLRLVLFYLKEIVQITVATRWSKPTLRADIVFQVLLSSGWIREKPVCVLASLLIVRGGGRSTEGAAVQHGQQPNRWVRAVQNLYMAVQDGYTCIWYMGTRCIGS